MAGVSALDTPLLRQIKKFGYAITAVIAVVAAIVFAYGRWVRGMDFVPIFQAVVSIAVSVIPEGLPALITVTLAIGVQRMAQRNAIIRRLPAVETLGSVSRICSDKTGTLTLMEMMVVSAVTAQFGLQSHRPRLCTRGRGSEGRGGGRGEFGTRADGAGFDALQRCGDPPGRRSLEGRGRPDGGCPLPLREQARSRTAGRADRLSEDRCHPVRIGTSLYGDTAQGRRR